MTSVDKRVVEMDFDNSKFEKGVAVTTKSLDALDAKLNGNMGAKNLTNITEAANSVDMSNISNGVDAINSKFSAMGAVGFTAISRITNAVIDLGKNLLTTMTSSIISGGSTRALNLEHAMFQFEGLGMDVEATMKDVSYAVDGTSYSLDAAAKVAAQYGASGMRAGNDMKNSLRAISGVAAMTGASYEDIGNIFTQVAGQGRLMGNDLLSLSSRGINAAATIAKSMNKSEAEVRDMVSKGKISFQQFADAMDAAFGPHAMKANETFTGALANVKSALGRIGAKFFTPFYENAKDVLNALRPVINDISAASDPLFNLTADWMSKLSAALAEFLKGLDFTEAKNGIQSLANKLSEQEGTFIKIANAAKSFAIVIGSLLTGAFRILQPILSVIFKLLGYVGLAIGGLLGGLSDGVSPAETFANAVEKVTTKIGEFISKIGSALPSLDSFRDGLSGIGSAITGSTGPGLEGLKKVLSFIGDLFGKAADGIAAFINKLDFNKVLMSGGIMGLIAALGGISGIIGKLQQSANNMAGFTELLKAPLIQLKNIMQAYQAQIQAAAIMKIALAIGIFALSLLVLSSIDPGKLAAGVTAIAALLAVLTVFMGALDNVAIKAGRFTVVSVGLIVLSVALLILSKAVSNLASLSWDELARGATALVLLSAVLVGLTAAMNGIKSKAIGGAMSMVIVAGALYVMVGALKALGTMEIPTLIQGFVAMTAILGVLVVALKFMQSAIGGATAMVIVAAALLVLTKSLEVMGNLPMNVLIQGGVAIAVMLAALVVSVNLMKSAMGGAIAMVLIASALMILANVITTLGTMPIESLTQGMMGIIGILIAFVAVSLILSPIAPAVMLIAAAMVVFSVGLLIAAAALVVTAIGLQMLVEAGFPALGMLALLAVALLPLVLLTPVLVVMGLGFLMLGVGLLAAGAGMALFSTVGPDAIGNLLLLGAAMIPLVAMAPLMLVVGAGLLLLGISCVIVSAGLMMLSFAFTNLATSAPMGIAALEQLCAKVVELAPQIGNLIALGAAFVVFGAGAILAGVGILLLGVGLVVLSAGLALLTSVGEEGIEALRKLGAASGDLMWAIPTLVATGAAFLAFGAGVMLAGTGAAACGLGLWLLMEAMSGFTDQTPKLESSFNTLQQAATSMTSVTPLLIGMSDTLRSTSEGLSSLESGSNNSASGVTALAIALSMVSTNLQIAMAITNASVGSIVGSLSTLSSSTSGLISQTSASFATLGPSVGSSLQGADSYVSSAMSSMVNTMNNMNQNIDNAVNRIGDIFDRMGPMINARIENAIPAANRAGVNLVMGFIIGGNALVWDVYDMGRQIGSKAVQGINDGAGNRSPSHKTNKSGRYIGIGLVNGMVALLSTVGKTGNLVGTTAVESVTEGLSNMPTDVGLGFSDPVITPVVDLSYVETAADKASRILSGGISSDLMIGASRTQSDSGIVAGTSYVINVNVDASNLNAKEIAEKVAPQIERILIRSVSL